jgi:rare lipoprotein A
MRHACSIGSFVAGLIVGSGYCHAEGNAAVSAIGGWQTTVIRGTAFAGTPAQGAAKPKAQSNSIRKHALEGMASYYGHGEKTASGEPFDKTALTAAHPTLPFHSLVRVKDRASGNTVVVRINDRGPFVPGRVIDLSEGAAEVIGMKQRGLTPVELEVLKGP